MDSLFSGLATHLIEWVDDRFGRTAAWIVGVALVLSLTFGTIVIGVAAFTYFTG